MKVVINGKLLNIEENSGDILINGNLLRLSLFNSIGKNVFAFIDNEGLGKILSHCEFVKVLEEDVVSLKVTRGAKWIFFCDLVDEIFDTDE